MGWDLAMQEDGDEAQLSPALAVSGVVHVLVALSVLLSRSVRTLPRARSSRMATV